MPTRNEMFPSKWLKASDVEPPDIGQVDACRVEMVGQGNKAERKSILYFHGTLKPHILNQTNWDAMVNLTGREDSDDWSGSRVELYAVDVVGPNGPTRGIRVRRPRPLTPKPLKGKATAPAKGDDIDDATEAPF